MVWEFDPKNKSNSYHCQWMLGWISCMPRRGKSKPSTEFSKINFDRNIFKIIARKDTFKD